MEPEKGATQTELFEITEEASSALDPRVKEQSGTFTPNMKLPVHRWFRYSAGFSAGWIETVLSSRGQITVLDPFVGSGTVCIEADKLGLESYGIEAHPFVYRLALGKACWDADVGEFVSAIESIRVAAENSSEFTGAVPDLLEKCFSPSALHELLALRGAFLRLAPGFSEAVASLVFLAINSILRVSSHVGTAQWQYILPNKRKAQVLNPLSALNMQARMMVCDMQSMAGLTSKAKIFRGDARTLTSIPSSSIDLVITSPPYANNYDYADATRLEMTYWQEVDSWGGLHEAVRKYLICSSSQHASKEKLDLEELLFSPDVLPIASELADVCRMLARVKLTKGGRKAYDTMLAAYFIDMGKIFVALRRVVRETGEICFVVGDSAPYGVHAPVDRWMGELAVHAGFSKWEFDKIRDRNVKWKNRKHTIPLHEGRLWIKG